MCDFFSCIVTRDKVQTVFGVDSHDDQVELLGLKSKDSQHRVDLVRIEVTPPTDGPITLEFERWNYKVDQDILPDWYVAEIDKQRVLDFMRELTAITEDVESFAGQAYFCTARVGRLFAKGSIRMVIGSAKITTVLGSAKILKDERIKK